MVVVTIRGWVPDLSRDLRKDLDPVDDSQADVSEPWPQKQMRGQTP